MFNVLYDGVMNLFNFINTCKPINKNIVLPVEYSEGHLCYQQMWYSHWCRHTQNRGLLLLLPKKRQGSKDVWLDVIRKAELCLKTKEDSPQIKWGENLPIELEVVNSYHRFYMAFFTSFTKIKRCASFFMDAAHETEVRIIFEDCVVVYEFVQVSPQITDGY